MDDLRRYFAAQAANLLQNDPKYWDAEIIADNAKVYINTNYPAAFEVSGNALCTAIFAYLKNTIKRLQLLAIDNQDVYEKMSEAYEFFVQKWETFQKESDYQEYIEQQSQNAPPEIASALMIFKGAGLTDGVSHWNGLNPNNPELSGM